MPTTSPHITKGPAVPSTWYVISSYQEKAYKPPRRQKFKETEQASEPDMVGMLALSVQEFKKTIINMLGALMDKVISMQKQMGNVTREMEVLRKNQKEILEIENTLKGMKNVSDGLISRLDTAEERISEFEDLSIESSEMKSKENRD